MNKVLASSEYDKGSSSDLQPLVARADQRVDIASQDEAAAQQKKPTDRSDAASAANDATRETSKPTASARLTEADIRMIQRQLLTGDAAVARRSDLGELNTRIVRMFETLNKGVGEMYVNKAEADRIMLSERVDTLEDAVNRMEGALRIEFEPVLRQAVAQVMEEHNAARPRRGRFVWMALVLLAGLAVGAVFHEQLASVLLQVETSIKAGASGIVENL